MNYKEQYKKICDESRFARAISGDIDKKFIEQSTEVFGVKIDPTIFRLVVPFYKAVFEEGRKHGVLDTMGCEGCVHYYHDGKREWAFCMDCSRDFEDNYKKEAE